MKFGVGFVVIGFAILSSFLVTESASCADRECLKSDLHSDAKSKEGIHKHVSPAQSMSHHGRNAENSMNVENGGMSRKESEEEESKEFENKDYGSYDPSPSGRQPRHKSTPN